MVDLHSPLHYFFQVVLPAYEELGRILLDGKIGHRRDLIAAGRAAEACLHLADHIAHDSVYNQSIPGAPDSKQYIQFLKKKYSNFAVARDIANSFKHTELYNQKEMIGISSIREFWALIQFTVNRPGFSGGHWL